MLDVTVLRHLLYYCGNVPGQVKMLLEDTVHVCTVTGYMEEEEMHWAHQRVVGGGTTEERE